MAHWVENKIKIHHDDTKIIDRIVDASKNGRQLDEFIPPESWDGEWLVKEGWTKIERVDDHTINMNFELKYGPPIDDFDRLVEIGCSVKGEMEDGSGVFLWLYENGKWAKFADVDRCPHRLAAEFKAKGGFSLSDDAISQLIRLFNRRSERRMKKISRLMPDVYYGR